MLEEEFTRFSMPYEEEFTPLRTFVIVASERFQVLVSRVWHARFVDNLSVTSTEAAKSTANRTKTVGYGPK